MLIKNLFKVSSQVLQIFKNFGGLKFRFEVLMFLIIKVNISIDLRLFQGTLKHLQARRIKGIKEGGYQLFKNVSH